MKFKIFLFILTTSNYVFGQVSWSISMEGCTQTSEVYSGSYTIGSTFNQYELVLRKDRRVEEMFHIDADMKPSLSIGKPKHKWTLDNDSIYLKDKQDHIYRKYKVININLSSSVNSFKLYNRTVKFQSKWHLLTDSSTETSNIIDDLNQFVLESLREREPSTISDEISEHEIVRSIMRAFFDKKKVYAKYNQYVNGNLSYE